MCLTWVSGKNNHCRGEFEIKKIVDKWGLSWAKLSRAGVKPRVGLNGLL